MRGDRGERGADAEEEEARLNAEGVNVKLHGRIAEEVLFFPLMVKKLDSVGQSLSIFRFFEAIFNRPSVEREQAEFFLFFLYFLYFFIKCFNFSCGVKGFGLNFLIMLFFLLIMDCSLSILL